MEKEELEKIEKDSYKQDEYDCMAWGSKLTIRELLKHIKEMKEPKKPRFLKVETVLGLTIPQIQEMKDYFKEHLIKLNK